jgi:hypothetical protein
MQANVNVTVVGVSHRFGIFHARCARHWEIGDCSFYSPGFSLLTVCVLWQSEQWTALTKTRTYRSRKSKSKSVIMSSPGSNKAGGKSSKIQAGHTDSECESDSNTMSDSSSPAKKLRKLSQIPENPTPVTTHVDVVDSAPALTPGQMIQLCEYMKSQTVVSASVSNPTTSGVVQGTRGDVWRGAESSPTRDWRDEAMYQNKSPLYRDPYWSDALLSTRFNRRSPLRDRIPSAERYSAYRRPG